MCLSMSLSLSLSLSLCEQLKFYALEINKTFSILLKIL